MDADALRKMTVAELREEAKKLGDVKGIAAMKKDELVRLLAGGDAKGASGGTRLAVLKHRVRELKAKRAEAGAKSQKAKVEEYNAHLRVLRRRLRRAARRRRNSA
jgi:hypothetical protein